MTISSSDRKAGPFVGNGITTEFPFAFKVFQESDVLVVQATDIGAESNLILGTNYTVSLNPNQNTSPGGTVTMLAALATNYLLVITSQIVELQPVDLTNSGGFYPTVINTALDRLTILTQQLREEVSRSLKVSITGEEEATADALIAEIQFLVNAASGYETTAEAAAVAAAASAIAAATFDPNSMGTIKFADGSFIQKDEMRFDPTFKRSMFKTSFTNGATSVGVEPNGTSTTSRFTAYNATISEHASFSMKVDRAEIAVSKSASEFGDAYRSLFCVVGNADRLEINNTGQVKVLGTDMMVGATSYPANVLSGVYVLNGVSAGGFRSHAGTSGAFTADAWNLHWNGANMALWVNTTNVGNLTITSDYRIKKDVKTMHGGALDRVSRLRPITYRHTDAEALNFKAADENVREGFLAHELAEVVPSAVDGEKDEANRIQTLRLDAVVALLTKAMQEQQAQIEELYQQIEALKQ